MAGWEAACLRFVLVVDIQCNRTPVALELAAQELARKDLTRTGAGGSSAQHHQGGSNGGVGCFRPFVARPGL
jgi:hypothetical protein